MDSLLSHLGLWLAAILAIGVVTAQKRRRAETDGGLSPWLGWGLLAFVLGLVVAGVGALPGRAGLWLDSGLASYAAFLIGCVAGALGRGGSLREHREWALGLLPATLLWLGANAVEIPRIEAARSEAAAPPNEDRATADNRAPAAADPKAEFLESARRQAENLARSQAAQREEPEAGAGDRTGSVAIQNLTPQQRAARLEAARATLAKLPTSGALEPPACQQALDASQRVSKALFAPGSYEITRAAATALDAADADPAPLPRRQGRDRRPYRQCRRRGEQSGPLEAARRGGAALSRGAGRSRRATLGCGLWRAAADRPERRRAGAGRQSPHRVHPEMSGRRSRFGRESS